jgi:chemotaxis family two-component system response regulator Rcp1
LLYSNTFLVQPNIPIGAWLRRPVRPCCNGQADASGLNLNSDDVPAVSLPNSPQTSPDLQSSEKPAWIVLVEDNPADVGLVQEALYEHEVRYALTVLMDGARALELIDRLDRERRPGPDLVLLDLNLPKKGGLEVLEHMRASVQWRAVPVVILTSSGAQEDRDRAAKLGATRYIRKPHRLDQFIQLGSVFKEMLTGSTRQ